MTRVIIVDDHTLIRMGIKGTLSSKCPDICVVGEAADGKSLFRLLETTPADLILLDIVLPDMNGIEIARILRSNYQKIKILVISVENTSNTIQQLLEIGIDGFISKRQCTGEELPEAIRNVMSGMEYFGRDIASIIYSIYVSKRETATATVEFSEREREIIHLCRNGFQSKEIGDQLHISPRTVETHKKNIFKKLGINNSLEMVQYALKKGIIQI